MIPSATEKYYKDRLAEHGPDAQGMGWKDTAAQRVRFEQLIKVIYTRGKFTVNDLGCGAGHLYPFLKKKFPAIQYCGYDVMEEMVNAAKKKFRKEKKAAFYRIASSSGMNPGDYTLASGIFNLKFSSTPAEWKEYIRLTLHDMDKKSKNGFAFNALTSYSDRHLMKEELFYSDPAELFDYCKRNFARNVALLHDYSQFDFTILVKKNF